MVEESLIRESHILLHYNEKKVMETFLIRNPLSLEVFKLKLYFFDTGKFQGLDEV